MMRKSDLCPTVPTFFRCPISLDVMESPVILSTGVTYDRSSIQRWIDAGHNTCPATMQVLHSKEFVPNRNLQRLIQIWSDSVHHRRRIDSDEDEIRTLVRSIESLKDKERCCFDGLSKLVSFAGESDDNCEFLVKLDGFVPMLLEILGDSNSIDLLELLVEVIDTILIKTGGYKQLMEIFRQKKKRYREILSSLLLVVQRGRKLCSRIGSVRMMESISMDAESKLLIAENDEVLSELVKSIGSETDRSLTESSLSCLIGVSTAKRVKANLISDLKIVAALRSLLTAAPNRDVSIAATEKALKLLEAVASCKEGKTEIGGEAGCVEAVVQKVLKVSAEATEHAVGILWRVCCVFGDLKAREAVGRRNGPAKLLVLMQSDCSPAVKRMATDLLKICRVNSESCLYSYDTETTHITPF